MNIFLMSEKPLYTLLSSMPFRMTCYKKISSTARCYSDSIDVMSVVES